jgi:large subunit ribosomal protein L4
MQIDVYNQKGEKGKSITLPKEIFGVEVKESLIHQALIRQLANGRSAIAHTKSRGQVRGGGRKPFRQKGTGRARQGTIRAPHMKGGGVVFGPTNDRTFTIQMPKKQRRRALHMALAAKANDGKIFALDKYEDKDGKTKNFAALLEKLPVERNVLVVLPSKEGVLSRVTSNLPNVKSVLVNYLNVHDLVKYDTVCFVGDSVDKTKEIFSLTK